MRFLPLVAAVVLVMSCCPRAAPQNQGFLGRWNLTGTGEDANRVYWLEVTEEGGQLSGMFLNRSGSPIKLASVAVQGKELVFQLAGRQQQAAWRRVPRGPRRRQARRHDQGRRPHHQFRRRPAAEVAAEQRQREARLRQAGRALRRQVLGGVRLPSRAPTPSPGRSRTASSPTRRRRATWCRSRSSRTSGSRPSTSSRPRATAASTCAAATRCRCSTTTASQPEMHGHMSIYGWTPPLVNASKPVGEWQTVDIDHRRQSRHRHAQRHESARQRRDSGDHRRRARQRRARARADSDPGRSHQGLVQEGDGHADQLTASRAQGSGLRQNRSRSVLEGSRQSRELRALSLRGSFPRRPSAA